jgi:crotonobetainyl-CoA:carnitine CoA-transferase CaiB-like acyl-CoA transferase
MMAGTNGGVLEGLRVLELGQLLAGPFAGHLVADMGAEVIKIEPPGRGDPMREWGHHDASGNGLWWPSLARNKKSVSLNLAHPEGQRLLGELVKHSDALIENFRPGTLEKWNLGPDKLRELNPRLVVVRVSGYGQTGPYADRVGFASAGEAMGGLRYINGYPDQPPPRAGISMGDMLAGMFAVQGLLAALYRRDGLKAGTGQVVDASILESCIAMLEGAITEYDRLGIVREPSGTGLRNIAPSNIYESLDGKWVVIAANADTLFARLCAAMDKPSLAADERFTSHLARGANAEELDEIIAAWAAGIEAREIDKVLTAHGVVTSPIYTVADIVADEHVQARDMVMRVHDDQIGELAVPGFVPKFSDTPGAHRWTGPGQVGQHNGAVLTSLAGLADQELATLREQGVI